MNRFAHPLLLLACLGVAALVGPARAEINWTGDVGPSDPSTWTSRDVGYIGDRTDGTVSVDGGSELLSAAGFFGNFAGASGELTVTGTGSKWKSENTLRIGISGSGTLNVLAGGTVTGSNSTLAGRSGSTGEVTVSGAGSHWDSGDYLYAGGAGHATLNILAGGMVTNTDGSLGFSTGSSGEATVSGAGSQWNNDGILFVGYRGGGTLRVEDGGHVSAGLLYASLIDLHGDGTITANSAVLDADLLFDATHGTQDVLPFGSGGALTVTAGGRLLGAGYKGAGSLTITEGVAVHTSYGRIGFHSGSTGIATVSGVGSQWKTSYELIVGNEGDGKLSVLAGGTVSSATGFLGSEPDSTGEATITGVGSEWTNSSNLYVGSRGDGTLNIQAGGTVSSIGGSLGAIYGSTGKATVNGTGSRWNNSGDLYVGYSDDAELTILHGGLVIVGGVLNVDNNLHDNGFINLSTGGVLALASDGTGDDSLSDFLELVEGTDAIRYWDDALSDWAPITNATYGDDYTLEYQTTGDLAGYTLLTVGEVPPYAPGDFNGDGVVDAADYTVARDHLGDPDETGIGYNGDGGGVDESDLELWRTHYGATLEPLTGEAVPEPSCGLLALGLLAAGTSVRRRGST